MPYSDFFYEPSEFEMQIDEFKQSLLESVRDEYKAEMERLRKENSELQDIKKDFKNIQDEYARKCRELEYERDRMERKVRSERLNTLLEGFQTSLYRADWTYEYPPKCDKCDENRRISYTTPLGREATENCTCKVSTKTYYPLEYVLYDISLYRDGSQLRGYYEPKDVDRIRRTVDEKDIYQQGTPFEELQTHRYTFFKSKEDCQRYCDWLNEKEEKQ